MERRQIQFRGRVQGVGFRATARSLASGFTVSGWVRNEADGSVLAEVQGEGREIESFLAALRQRLGGFIASEQASPCPVDQSEAGFVIQR